MESLVVNKNTNQSQQQQQHEADTTDTLNVTLPHGISAKVTGPVALTIILISVATFSILYFLKDHNENTNTKITTVMTEVHTMAEKMEEIGFILTLSEEERKKLNLNMPDSLRKRTRGYQQQ